ncbi:hypothetical protein SRB17_03450 [Streptomyces sp. RB17]|uniref:hypothetical protein n=1 Tax=Streptomyces sp. RB17 TaxID=2585197 RepID=UPI001294A65A|nr:hypothetical protein [Streptomyces sp. RB17]MQY32397.1 hypothetical protein [Streptomyces sp. RB17]
MGVPPVRRVASTVLCAALLAGVTGPAAFAADATPHRNRAAAQEPVPGADKLLTHVNSLGLFGTVLQPVSTLLDAVLKADRGQLSADQANRLVKAAKDAVAKAGAAAPGTSTGSAAQGELSLAGRNGSVSEAQVTLTKAIDTLQKAATDGQGDQVSGAVHGVLSGLLGLLTSLLGL